MGCLNLITRHTFLGERSPINRVAASGNAAERRRSVTARHWRLTLHRECNGAVACTSRAGLLVHLVFGFCAASFRARSFFLQAGHRVGLEST